MNVSFSSCKKFPRISEKRVVHLRGNVLLSLSFLPAQVHLFPTTFTTSFFEQFAKFGQTYLHEAVNIPVLFLIPVLLACPDSFLFWFCQPVSVLQYPCLFSSGPCSNPIVMLGYLRINQI